MIKTIIYFIISIFIIIIMSFLSLILVFTKIIAEIAVIINDVFSSAGLCLNGLLESMWLESND